MQRKKLELLRKMSDRTQALRSDRLRRAAASVGMDRRDADDAARRTHFGV